MGFPENHKKEFKTKKRASLTMLVGAFAVLFIAGAALVSCSDDSKEETITLYSGRSDSLLGPLIERFESQSGINVETKYGGSAEMALLIEQEGDKSPADLVILQSPGAMQHLSAAGLLAVLPNDVSGLLTDAGFTHNDWIGITGRERVIVYNTNLVSEEDLPNSIADLTDPKYKGKVAVAPDNGSFQDFVTGLRAAWGDAQTKSWLEGMAANDSPNYPKNSAIVSAVIAGEVEMGLVNHYYLLRAIEDNPNAPARNYFLPEDDPGSLLILSNVGILKSSDKQVPAAEFIKFLLNDESQAYFSQDIGEYPLLSGVPAPDGAPPLAGYVGSLDVLGNLNLGETLDIIEQSGIKK